MNIYARPGTKVVYLDKYGYDWQPIDARKNGFIKGEQYTISSIDVHSSSTTVYFYEIKGGYNSVMFADV